MLAVYLLGFSSLATAMSVVGIGDYVRSLDTRTETGIPAQDFDNIKFYAQHAAAAYCNFKATPGSVLKCDKSACPLVEKNAPTVLASFAGSSTGVGAYVSLDEVRQEIVLSVRGSDSIRNYLTDIFLSWHICHFTSDCKVHVGFSKSWREIRDDVTSAVQTARGRFPKYRFITVGHSLGGASALLALADFIQDGIPTDLYTYGCPRVGNDHFVDWIDSQPGVRFRVTHGSDPVARLPPLWMGYRHTSPEYWLSKGGGVQDEPDVEIRVCDGIKNSDCNAGTGAMDVWAHMNYLGDTSACMGDPIVKWKRDDAMDSELEERLIDWSQQDRDFVKKNSK
ncbi:hypothetical protein E4U24_005356 [Claviceps purpurea]|nr:hypothetical protein E4U38_001449 [Claviceps purpurea]KAG6153903.1 hypothetical protein E4U37_002561 [Claviceps purpurea]KAG6168692.1 hypothetical protein E4U11_005396 [Claviceps purpurea]KAG6231227.1 hypothetical protein E4U34_005814 [Claviceps purpurea]KAG6243606.1 hypothetical protein E4U24_005356 [Claviceps purpurea]